MSTISEDQTFQPHPQYDEFKSEWQKCRDCTAGQRKVKARGRLYLGRPSVMDDSNYELYLQRAVYLNEPGKTLNAMAGAVERKPPTVEVPGLEDGSRDIVSNIGLGGESLRDLMYQALIEQIRVGRIGILSDVADDDDDDRSPYFVLYKAERIINWNSEMWAGRKVRSLITLSETDYVVMPPFGKREKVERVRNLRLIFPDTLGSVEEQFRADVGAALVDAKGAPVYIQELWRRDKNPDYPTLPNNVADIGSNAADWVLEDVVIPEKADGNTWSEIPFVFINSESTDPDVEKPPLLDLCEVALSYYRSSGSLEWGQYWVSIPTPLLFMPGDTGPQEVTLGPSQMIRIGMSPNDADAKMLEYNGQGLSNIQRTMDEKKLAMTSMGTRLLHGGVANQVETADAIRMRMSGESATLGTIISAASSGWTQALKYYVGWTPSVSSVPSVQFNSDVHPTRLVPGELATLSQAVAQKIISLRTFFYNLKVGEIIPPGVTFEEELELIQEDIERAKENQIQGVGDGPDEGVEEDNSGAQLERSLVNQHSQQRAVPRPG